MTAERPLVSYIPASDAAEIVKNGRAGREWVVIDVRGASRWARRRLKGVADDDYRGGHIKGAVNVASLSFEDQLPSLVQRFADVPNVIVHCSLSQQRGPKAARMYADAAARAPSAHAAPASAGPNVVVPPEKSSAENASAGSAESQRVMILRGGFSRFQELYRDDADLVEGWDKLVWAPFD